MQDILLELQQHLAHQALWKGTKYTHTDEGPTAVVPYCDTLLTKQYSNNLAFNTDCLKGENMLGK